MIIIEMDDAIFMHTIFAQFKWHSKIEDDNKKIRSLGTHFDGSAFAFVCVAWKRQWNVSKISSFMLDEREEKEKKLNHEL